MYVMAHEVECYVFCLVDAVLLANKNVVFRAQE